jgi:hypothetical protein
MNLTLIILIFFFLAAVITAAVLYYLTLQNLAAVKREVDKLRTQADDARASAVLRNERARCYQQLLALESGLQSQPRESLGAEELAMVDINREEIRNCVEALKRSGNWMGLPYDLDWQDMWENLPALQKLYRVTVVQEAGQGIAGAASPAAPPPSGAAATTATADLPELPKPSGQPQVMVQAVKNMMNR